MSYSPYDAKIALIFLNEFYNIKGLCYQDYITRYLTDKYRNYHKFIGNQKHHTEYTSLMDVLGINKYYQYQNFPMINKCQDDTIYQSFTKQRANVKITHTGNIITMEIDFLDKNSLNTSYYNNPVNVLNTPTYQDQFRAEWLVKNLDLLKNSKVISYHVISSKNILVKVDETYIKFKKPMTLWTKIFKYYLNTELREKHHDLLYFTISKYTQFCVYLPGEITKTSWLITDSDQKIILRWCKTKNIDDKLVEKLFYVWFQSIEWVRKREIILLIYQLEKLKSRDSFFDLFFNQDIYLQKKILSYL